MENDLISRAALLQSIGRHAELDGNRRAAQVLDCILSAPTIDPKSLRPEGQWIWDTDEIYPKPLCSRCRKEPWRRSNDESDLPNYCPNCGARMEGGEDDD